MINREIIYKFIKEHDEQHLPKFLKQELTAQLSAIYPETIARFYSIDKVIAHTMKYFYPTGIVDNNPSITVNKKEKALNWAGKQVECVLRNQRAKQSLSNSDLADFELKASTKWTGPQGSTPKWEELLDIVELYFCRYSPWTMDPDTLSQQTLSYVHAAITDKHQYQFKQVELPTLDEFDYTQIHAYPKPDRQSNSGIIGFSDRREEQIYLKNWILAKRYPNNFDPAVMGTRHMRNKFRGIYMDSLANWFRMWPEYTTLANTFKQSNSVFYAPIQYTEAHIQKFLSRHPEVIFFESDYESMDTWVTEGHANFTFAVIEKIFKGTFPDVQMNKIKSLNHQVFTMPIITPAGLLSGNHNLLSGTLPTNYIETPLNLIINSDFIATVINPKCKRPLIYGVDYIIVVLGDDVLILIDKTLLLDPTDYDWLCEAFCTFAWSKYRIKANVSKQRVSTVSGFFCKRQFRRVNKQREIEINGKTMNVTHSAYPITLVINNIVWPERHPYVSKAQYILTTLSRLDNAVGSPLFKNLVCYTRDVLCAEFKDVVISQDDIDEYNNSSRTSFRVKLYGETFSIENSPSAKIWFELES